MSIAEEIFRENANVAFPENQAGGTGNFELSTYEEYKELVFEAKGYDCQAPYILNKDKVIEALKECGYTLGCERS